MKVVDIADEIYRELSTPTDISVSSVSFWVRSNIGALNSHIHTSYSVDADLTGSAQSNNSGLEVKDADGNEIGIDEAAILKKMYLVHYYDILLRSNIASLSTDTIVFVSDQGSSVKKIDKLNVAKHLGTVKASEEGQLRVLIRNYVISKVAPRQVTGDDLEEGTGLRGSFPYGTNFRTS